MLPSDLSQYPDKDQNIHIPLGSVRKVLITIRPLALIFVRRAADLILELRVEVG